MVRAVARLAAVGSLIAVLSVAAVSPSYADGALGLNGPTGEPLPWTLAAVVGLGGAAFLVRAVLRLRPAPQAQRVTAPQSQRVRSVSGASRTAQLVSTPPEPAGSLSLPAGSLSQPAGSLSQSVGSLPASSSSRASRSSADAAPAR